MSQSVIGESWDNEFRYGHHNQKMLTLYSPNHIFPEDRPHIKGCLAFDERGACDCFRHTSHYVRIGGLLNDSRLPPFTLEWLDLDTNQQRQYGRVKNARVEVQ